MSENIVVFDIETTGLDKTKDSIIQFAAIKINKATNKMIDELNLYIQPEGSYTIGFGAYFKHGIKPDFLKDKPHMRDVADKIIEFFGNDDILTYNGLHFDIPFLINELNKVGKNLDIMNRGCYDAFLEEKRRNGTRLVDAYERYAGKTMEEAGLNAHDALSDVKATYSVYYAQQKREKYDAEKILCEDNVIAYKDFMGKDEPCFTIGKYRDVSVKYVAEIDSNYLNWAISDKCSFMPSTKEYIKQYL